MFTVWLVVWMVIYTSHYNHLFRVFVFFLFEIILWSFSTRESCLHFVISNYWLEWLDSIYRVNYLVWKMITCVDGVHVNCTQMRRTLSRLYAWINNLDFSNTIYDILVIWWVVLLIFWFSIESISLRVR